MYDKLTTIENTMEQISKAHVNTEKASRYLQQLCKHFAHKIPVTHTPEQGDIDFNFGRCELRVAGSQLFMMASAEESENLQKVQKVISEHLKRFAFRESLQIEWR